MIRPILIYPDPALRTTAREVAHVDDTTRTLINDLRETMLHANGIGLAAPQVGVDLRVLVIAHDRGARAFINPFITKRSRKMVSGEEGCLSIPGVFGTVPRCKDVEVQALDENGASFTFKAKGLAARVLQHEIDHLNGALFIDLWTAVTDGRDTAARFGIALP